MKLTRDGDVWDLRMTDDELTGLIEALDFGYEDYLLARQLERERREQAVPCPAGCMDRSHLLAGHRVEDQEQP